MTGIIKECNVCGKPFTTNSIKTSTQIHSCVDCWGKHKQSALTKNLTDKMHRAVMSIETRLDRLEESQQVIPMLIGAEISTAMMDINGLAGLDIKGMIKTELEDAKADLLKYQNAQFKSFRLKIQGQIVTVNNKIVKLMREMQKND